MAAPLLSLSEGEGARARRREQLRAWEEAEAAAAAAAAASSSPLGPAPPSAAPSPSPGMGPAGHRPPRAVRFEAAAEFLACCAGAELEVAREMLSADAEAVNGTNADGISALHQVGAPGRGEASLLQLLLGVRARSGSAPTGSGASERVKSEAAILSTLTLLAALGLSSK